MADEILKRLSSRSSVSGGIAKMLSGGKRRFLATLCHVGQNLNGHLLTEDEARKAVEAFTKAPIRMTKGKVLDPSDAHPETAEEIIGRMIAVEYVPEPGGGRIDFIGEVYDTTAFAKHAHEIISDGFYAFDSWESDYAEGECTVCHHRFADPADICRHLAVDSAGRPIGTGSAGIITHGVVLTGVSMLDRQGADPNARVKAVATLAAKPKEATMADDAKIEANTAPAAGAADTATAEAKLADLQAKFDAMSAENTDLKGRLATFEKKERDAKVAGIVAAMIERGKTLDDKGKAEKAAELSAMSDAELAVAEKMVLDMPVQVAAKTDDAPPAETPAPLSATASRETPFNPPAAGDPSDGSESDAALDDFYKSVEG